CVSRDVRVSRICRARGPDVPAAGGWLWQSCIASPERVGNAAINGPERFCGQRDVREFHAVQPTADRHRAALRAHILTPGQLIECSAAERDYGVDPQWVRAGGDEHDR